MQTADYLLLAFRGSTLARVKSQVESHLGVEFVQFYPTSLGAGFLVSLLPRRVGKWVLRIQEAARMRSALDREPLLLATRLPDPSSGTERFFLARARDCDVVVQRQTAAEGAEDIVVLGVERTNRARDIVARLRECPIAGDLAESRHVDAHVYDVYGFGSLEVERVRRVLEDSLSITFTEGCSDEYGGPWYWHHGIWRESFKLRANYDPSDEAWCYPDHCDTRAVLELSTVRPDEISDVIRQACQESKLIEHRVFPLCSPS